MREILFRAKRTDNGEWCEGYLSKSRDENKHLKLCIDYEEQGVMCSSIVIPEMVGQYTGLTDKNGKKIFEGDIVDVEYDIQYFGVAAERIGLFVVVFYDGCFMKQKKDGGLFHFISSDKCEVVGNIHDSPELLKGSEE